MGLAVLALFLLAWAVVLGGPMLGRYLRLHLRASPIVSAAGVPTTSSDSIPRSSSAVTASGGN